jgi:hypothetical protein
MAHKNGTITSNTPGNGYARYNNNGTYTLKAKAKKVSKFAFYWFAVKSGIVCGSVVFTLVKIGLALH